MMEKYDYTANIVAGYFPVRMKTRPIPKKRVTPENSSNDYPDNAIKAGLSKSLKQDFNAMYFEKS